MWKSVIRDYPEEEDEWGNLNPLFLEWIEALTSEPWLVALQDLVRWTRIWTGTEAELMEEIRSRVNREAWESEDFPSDFPEFREFYMIAWQLAHYISSGGLGLALFRYDELTEKELKEFYAPGWGPEAPILVERDGAARPPTYTFAMVDLAKYQEPLLLAFLIFTDSTKFVRNKRWWSGSTEELVEVLLGCYPMPSLNCRMEVAYVKWSSYPELNDMSVAFFDHSSMELISDSWGWDRSDYRRFHGKMKTCASILEEVVGIKLSKKKVTHTVREPGGEVRKTKRTRWVIEAPPWRS